MNCRQYTTPPPGRKSWWLKLAAFGAALALFGSTATAQTANTYAFSAMNGASLDPMSGATDLGTSGDDSQTAVTNIGFNFVYEGATYTTFSANTNGVMALGGAVGTAYNNTTSFTPASMCILWDDHSGVSISTTQLGSAGARIRIIQFNLNLSFCTPAALMQIWLYEGTNVIEYRYGSSTSGCTQSATIALVGANTANFISITPPSSTSTSTRNNSVNWPGNGKMYTFTPVSCIPPSVSASVTGTDCGTSTFTVAVNLTSLGNATSINLVPTSGAAMNNITTPGVYNFTFPTSAAPVSITAVHNVDALCNVVMGTFSPTVICVSCGSPLDQTFCYGNNSDNQFVYQTSPGTSLRLSMLSGNYETCCDHVYIYNGVGTGGTLLYQSAGSGDVTGVQAISTSNAITLRITGDVSISCQSGSFPAGMHWTVACNTCTPPSATASQTVDCNTNTYTVNVNVTSIGDAASVNVNVGGNTIGDHVGVGSYTSSPIAIGTSSAVSVVHNGDASCNIALSTFNGTGVLCNDNCSGAVAVSCPNSYAGTNVGATSDGLASLASGGDATIDNGVWYKYLGDNSAVTASLCGSSFDTRIHVYKGSCGSLVGVDGNDDFCGVQSQVSFNALAGTTYYIIVEGYGFAPGFHSSGSFTLSLSCAPLCSPIVSNEDCGTAAPLTLSSPGTCSNAIVADNHCAAATAGNPTCFGTFQTYPDIWYSFTASATLEELIITNITSTSMGFGLYSGTCGSLSQVTCNSAVTSGAVNQISGLTVGQTYYLRIMSLATTAGSFSLCMRDFQVPAENSCPGVDLNTLTSPYSQSTQGSTGEQTLACGNSTDISADHVFHIDVPDQNTLRIGDLSTTYDAAHELLTGAVCPGTAVVACSGSDLQQESYANTSGTTQTLWWVQDGEFGSAGSYTLQWQLLNCIEPAATAGTQVINCTTTPQFYVNVNLTSLGNSGTVDIISDQHIGDATGVSATGSYQLGPFAAGSTANVTVVHNGNNTCNKSLGAFSIPTNPVCNDFCADAIVLHCGDVISGTNIGATIDGTPSQVSGGSTTVQYGVWYSYVGDDQQVTLSTCGGPLFDTRIHVYRGSCGSLIGVGGNDDAGAACSTSTTQSIVSFNALVGNTYYIAVEGYGGGQGNFQLTTTCGPLCNPLVLNDDCSNAQLVTMSSNCNPVGGNLSCATSTAGQNPSCAGSSFATYNDAYYYFVATGPDAYINLSSSNPNLQFAIYNGSCGGSQIACSNVITSGVPTLVTGLTTGNTYYLRVFQLLANAGSFTLCVQKLDVSDDPCAPIVLNCGDLRFGRTVGRANNIPAGACPFNGAASTGGVNYFSYTAANDRDVTFSLCGQTDFNTRISVFDMAPDCNNLVCNVQNDDAAGCPNNSSEVILRAHAGTTYLVMVSGAGAAEGTYQLSVFCQGWCSLSEGNDRCSEATALTTYLDDGSGVISNEDQSCAYADAPTSCSGAGQVQGVWYTFNTGANHLFNVYLATNGINPAYTASTISYAVYNGACSGVGATGEVACVSNGAGTTSLPSLQTNTDYRLLVYNAGGATIEGTFGLMVTHPGANDAAIGDVLHPIGTVCDQKIFPQFYLKGVGEANVTSATLVSYIDGVQVQSYNWTGNVHRGDSVLVSLPVIGSPSGAHSYDVVITSVNGGTDDVSNNNSGSSFYDATGQTVKVALKTDNFGGQTSWTIYDAFFFPVAFASGNTLPSNTAVTTTICLPTTFGNCFSFLLFDQNGDGICCANGIGDWALLDVLDRPILHDNGQFTFQSPNATPASSGYLAHEFCLPLGPSAPLSTECNIFNNLLENKVFCQTVPGVTNYQFEFSDPDAGYRRRIAVPRNWVKFSEMQTNPLAFGVTYFTRVRVDQGSTGFSDDLFGAGCDMALAPSQPICTELISTPGPSFSCGVTKRFNGSDKIYAQPVVGATQYRFNFTNPGEGYTRNIIRPSYVCPLSWTTLPLVNGSTYQVRVECQVSGVWSGFCGATCTLTINNAHSAGRVEVADNDANDGVQLWPNPVRDGRVNLVINGLTDPDQAISVDVYDIFGKRVIARQYENSGNVFNTVLELNSDMAAGIYVVNITVNGTVHTQRLSVQ